MAIIKNPEGFDQLYEVSGNKRIVSSVENMMKDLTQSQLYVLEKITNRNLQIVNKLPANPMLEIPAIGLTVILSNIRLEENKRRDGLAEILDDELNRAKVNRIVNEYITQTEPEVVIAHRRMRKLLIMLKPFRRRVGQEEYVQYKKIESRYNRLKTYLQTKASTMRSYLFHPTKAETYGEYGDAWKDVKGTVKKNRKRIERIKAGVFRLLKKRHPDSYQNIAKIEGLLEQNLSEQNRHQYVEKDHWAAVNDVVTRYDLLNPSKIETYQKPSVWLKFILGLYSLASPELFTINIFKIGNRIELPQV
jgi:hypothetical protein